MSVRKSAGSTAIAGRLCPSTLSTGVTSRLSTDLAIGRCFGHVDTESLHSIPQPSASIASNER